MTDSRGYDPRYVRGVEYFNVCAFFDAHEVWEGLWLEADVASRSFYQGLIQAAVCLHHFGNRNTRGARKLFWGASKYLQPYSPHYQGIDVRQFLAELRHCCAAILDDPRDSPTARLDPALIPKLTLPSAAGRSAWGSV